MKRYKEFVLKAEKGIAFEVSDVTRQKVNYQSSEPQHTCSENYANPPIPEGYKHICGEWNNGFVIERGSDGSQFVWIPVGSLDSNGTLDGEHFSEKFGRRNYMNNEFSDNEYNEALNGELLEQIESVKKYGGFYISRYNISRNENGEPQSVKGVMPLNHTQFKEARMFAASIEDNEVVKSHLTFGAEYDSVLEWFIKTGVRTRYEIVIDSSKWGNYDTEEDFYEKSILARILLTIRGMPKIYAVITGSREEWCTNSIYDFAGNVSEWTQEKKGSFCGVIRGGDFSCNVGKKPVAYRTSYGMFSNFDCTGFRATLWIK